jgi:hypothetical protein
MAGPLMRRILMRRILMRRILMRRSPSELLTA